MILITKIQNDKYYTPIEIANHCIDLVLNIIDKNNISEVIEPSVGNGSFLHHSDLHINYGYDIEPEVETNIINDTKIIKGDYLFSTFKYLKGRLIIGNPPYGRCLNLAQRFYKKAVTQSDYIAFILPISQLNNNHFMYEFDLIYSEDLGMQHYSDRDLHCCFNIYIRPQNGELNKKPISKLKDITIYRQDCKDYHNKDFDIRMCYWGDGSAGKILQDGESYSGEYKIKINNQDIKDDIINVLATFDWKDYLDCIAMRRIKQYHIIEVLKKYIPDIK